MTHFLCLLYLSFAISIVVATTATNDPAKMLRRTMKYFGMMVVGSVAVGWLMFLLSP